MPKGKYYLKGRYTNMKKFLAIFMVVAVVMGMTFIVMSSAEASDFTYTVNVSEPVDGKSTVTIDIDVTKPLSAISMDITVADGVTIVEKAKDAQYYKGNVKLDPESGEAYQAFNNLAVAVNGQVITFTTASTADVSDVIGGSAGIFPSSMKGFMTFDLEGVTAVNAETVKVTSIKCMSGLDTGVSEVVYNLPEQEETTTTKPEQEETTTTKPEQEETTTTKPEQEETTTEPEQVETTTEPEQVETTTSDDPNTSDGSSLSMIVFVVLAVVSLACAAVVIVRRKRA